MHSISEFASCCICTDICNLNAMCFFLWENYLQVDLLFVFNSQGRQGLGVPHRFWLQTANAKGKE